MVYSTKEVSRCHIISACIDNTGDNGGIVIQNSEVATTLQSLEEYIQREFICFVIL